jgi:hypothetical protein
MSKLSRFKDRHWLRFRKAVWRLGHNYSPDARPVFILGAQRSGTTMLIKCLDESSELEVLGEASRAMIDWRIRDLAFIRGIVTASRHRAVIFKPLTDSHRVNELLAVGNDAVGIWMYRRAADRANSAVNRFGANNLAHLSAFVVGDMLDTWQAQGLSNESLTLLRRFDFDQVSPHSAAGLFWYIRNALFFEQQLDLNASILPLAYEDLVEHPAGVMKAVCEFIGCDYSPSLHASIHSRSIGRAESKLEPAVDALGEEMYERLREAQRQRFAAAGLSLAGSE